MLRALKHEGEKQMPKRKNEEGENVRAIYDVDGLLTSISLNCDELFRTKLDSNQKQLVEGIQHMIAELVRSV